MSYQNIGRIVIGSRYGNQDEDISLTLKILKEAGIPCVVSDDIMYTQWKKLMLNTGINQAITGVRINLCRHAAGRRIRTRMIEAIA